MKETNTEAHELVGWDIEFDEKFTNEADLPANETMLFEPTTGKIKSFIRSLIEATRREELEWVLKVTENNDGVGRSLVKYRLAALNNQ